ncbi:MAG: YqeG family HAD IIIA-type phosphatase [Mycoplasmataceae bacterium]|nr:YqeG family HAD IIIA-type phosphatase [Mycoplasmataceae bacterium]
MERKRKGIISNFFRPSIYVRSFNDININQLKRQGIKLMVCDLDNTLAPHYTKFPNKDVLKFINGVKSAGIEFVILSNNIRTRVGAFAKKAEVDNFYPNGKKPFKKVAKKILDERNYIHSDVIFVGDQIIMDILVANRLKCESILVQPLVSTDYKMNSFNLFLENRIYKNLERKNILKKGDFSTGNLGDGFELI